MAYPSGKKTYAELDLGEKFQWHASVYAFRLVVLDQPLIAGTSPADPTGEWYDQILVEHELGKLRQKHLKRPRTVLGEDDRRQGVAMLNTFAATKGFVSWDAAYDAGVTYADAIRWVMAGRSPIGSGRNWDHYRPSADELARAREALGLTATEQTPQPETQTEENAA
jgi:hypothetical protein